jgi:DNA-binding transcriptional LysR family regulator
VLLDHAKTVLEQFRITEDGLRSLRSGEVGRLVIGSYQSVSVKVLPDVIGRLRSERPGLTIRCVENDENDELIARLLGDELDLTFLTGALDHEEVDVVQLLCDPFVLVSPGGAAATATTDELLRGPMIGQPSCACQLAIDQCLREAGLELDYVFRTNDNAAVQAMVRAGMGCAIMPFLAVDQHDPEVDITSMEQLVAPRTISLARRRHRTLIPAGDRFVELAAAVCGSLARFEPVPV